MPDGFDPHKELARIYVLKDLMQACRAEMPLILDTIKECLSDDSAYVRLMAANMMLDRGFGKPRQHHVVADIGESSRKRVVILPDNGRNTPGEIVTIDGEANAQ